MEDEDFLLALSLQEEFDQEAAGTRWNDDEDYPSSKRRKIDSSSELDVVPFSQSRPERPLSIVDESWETLDPNPDVRAMFLQFNDMFFWGKLCGVEVKWSPRMTLCAGLCSYEGRGGLCSVRLSEPLLKLRPRKDLVQTLLHEMIHALLFVTQNNRDRDGHGPEFCKHMNRINQASGTSITIYHSFHDEVDVYRQHWWRCSGPCQNRRPFFGYVKRAMNRPPSARDPWWAEHQRTCGGTYTKIKEPENYGKSSKTDQKKDKNAISEKSKTSKPPGSSTVSGSQAIRNIMPFSGRGFVLGGSTQNSMDKQPGQSPLSPTRAQPLVSPPRNDSPSHSIPWSNETNPYKRLSSGSSNVLGKKSVGNTSAFDNINGSPVRISKANGSLRAKQRMVRDLFQSKVLRSPERSDTTVDASKLKSNGPASSSTINNRHSSTITGPKPGSSENHVSKYFGNADNIKTTVPELCGSPKKSETSTGYISKHFGGNQRPALDTTSSGLRNSPQKPRTTTLGSNSKHFGGFQKPEAGFPSPRNAGSPQTSGTSTSGARKKPREEQNSAHIFDYFQRTVSETSTVKRREESGEAARPDRDQQADSSPVQITVHCPVCLSKIFESKINEHLDACLT
ncbi:putative sprT-like domain-containing protein Spartan [Triplophysa rosa]|uniref:DNA-dependent metalloprotease SPRTN n=2 Tax=Triplophysa rosa TaxID=992332 RepID=A0A9W7WH84_TRIRA|nr:putative sprT-like domain-containing protein Spartan [Triplophysa rosa]